MKPRRSHYDHIKAPKRTKRTQTRRNKKDDDTQSKPAETGQKGEPAATPGSEHKNPDEQEWQAQPWGRIGVPESAHPLVV